jgi:hypothetical protein
MSTNKVSQERSQRIEKMAQQLTEGRNPLAVKYDKSNMPSGLTLGVYLEVEFFESSHKASLQEAIKKHLNA